MRAIFAVVLLIGLGLAGFAVYMAQNYIEGYQSALAQERASKKPEIATTDVFVTTRPMKYGEELTVEDIQLVKFPKDALPEGVFATKEDLFPQGEDVVRYVVRAMEEKEAILAIKVTKPGEDAGLTTRLQKGMRAFAIKVDVASGVSGFLRPGDRVDVYWTGRVKGMGGELGNDEVTKLIQTSVTLIAIDQSADGEIEAGNVAKTVTVAAKPQQVASLAQAQKTGDLMLALVGAEDDTVASVVEVDQRSLLGIEAPEEKIVERIEEERVCTIKTRRGAEVVQIPIPCTN
ncbi:Flp pilus assembly protein CpaB [Shimia thalassica]|jgi:pilus assembly protein CpaB|uniref:Flp pilus assembly protein CpaB n=1 Tax=Shimia thalassica TaxID=1715693 RepID=UPI000C084782|nr:Flp pilus assembly protein CpaB [Shimia thalassica]PHO05781.1 Flp pilus assembly protein CpaB [Rhodobacteraceae bacterium 4F10]MBU2942701.1 Flp pilus assembly protein CpaB [Shimia thalassica]MDO6480222.1 Flp pilus assembly protein CpaB [Shimia thalassica]MDO6484287.1 Flp pilus assembly protein CpaB [Shimia thalassica]MDO6502531.1 Flp pilus assembly protein CpaB [Shimia thalassica]